MSGTKGHNHTVRALVPPCSAVFGVSLWILPLCGGVPVVWGAAAAAAAAAWGACCCLVVGEWVLLPLLPLLPGSGVLPTVGRGR